MCISLMKLWLISIILLISICSFCKVSKSVKVKWKRERDECVKKKKERLLFKCPRCQCNALQGYKASHYSLAFVESSSGQIVTGLFLNRYWEKRAEQRTPNYPVLCGTIKLLIREATEHSLSPSVSVWAHVYGQFFSNIPFIHSIKYCEMFVVVFFYI